ncbi:MAG: hypothetical protein AAFN10_05840 [Bacteroidota bacterium]
MKYYSLLGAICLLFLTDICFAQRSVESISWQFGLFSHHYIANETVPAPFSKGATITPLRHQIGLSTQRLIGQHFGLGLRLSYFHRQGEGYNNDLYRTGIYSPSSEDRVFTYNYHRGDLELYGRWYLQKPTAALRTFAQLNIGTQLQYAGTTANPYHSDPSQQAARPLGLHIGGAFLAGLGGGLQYRWSDNWGMDAALMLSVPFGLYRQPFDFSRYGLQLGIYRMIRPKQP